MEDSDLENDKTELSYRVVASILPLVLLNRITNDNVSEQNGLSGLDQVILSQVGDDPETFRLVKGAILIQAGFIQKLIGNNSMSPRVLSSEILRDLYGKEGYLQSTSSLPEVFNSFNDPGYQRKIRKVAQEYLKGTLTTDNPSRLNGLTGFEQAIHYTTSLLPTESAEEYQRNLEEVYKLVQVSISDLNGGSNLGTFQDYKGY